MVKSKNIYYSPDWKKKTKKQKIKEVIDSERYIIKHFGIHHHAKVKAMTKKLLKRIEEGKL